MRAELTPSQILIIHDTCSPDLANPPTANANEKLEYDNLVAHIFTVETRKSQLAQLDREYFVFLAPRDGTVDYFTVLRAAVEVVVPHIMRKFGAVRREWIVWSDGCPKSLIQCNAVDAGG